MPTLEVHSIVTPPFSENTYVAIDPTTKRAAVIDPGTGALAFWRSFEAQGYELERILLTHGHLDHVFGLEELVDAHAVPVHLHRDDIPQIEQFVERAAIFGLEVEPLPMPDQILEDGDTVSIGNVELRVIHTPGHSRGGVAFVWDDGLFSGDTLMGFSVGRTDFPESSHADLVRSIQERLYTLPDELTLYPGHMDPTTIGDEKKYNQFVRP